MKSLKIACTNKTEYYFYTDREIISAMSTDYTDVAAAVVNECDIEIINSIYDTKFGIDIFVIAETDNIDESIKNKVAKIVKAEDLNTEEFSKEISEAANRYEEQMLPPFFDVLSKYSLNIRQEELCMNFLEKIYLNRIYVMQTLI